MTSKSTEQVELSVSDFFLYFLHLILRFGFNIVFLSVC